MIDSDQDRIDDELHQRSEIAHQIQKDRPPVERNAMKERELANHTTCSLCSRLVTASGLPLFWRVRIERFGISLPAMKRQMGLSDFLGGNAALARVMGPDEDIASPVMEPVMLTVCETCACERATPIAAMALAS